jgi:hypothetical protein
METAPWYTSAIVRQQIVQFLSAVTGLLGLNLGGLNLDQTVANIFLGIAAVMSLYTFVTRITKTAPNLSAAAVRNEIHLVATGKIPPSATGPVETTEGVS